MKKKYNVKGMKCAACAAKIEEAISELSGIKKVNVNFINHLMEVDFDMGKVNSEQIVKVVHEFGYAASEKTEARALTEGEEKLKKRFVLSLIFAAPLFMISMRAELPAPFLSQSAILWTCFVLAVPIIIVNFRIYTVGFSMLFKKTPCADSLIATGTLISLIILRFDYVGVILTLATLVKWVEIRVKKKAASSIESIIQTGTAYAIKRGQGLSTPVAEVKKGATATPRPVGTDKEDTAIAKIIDVVEKAYSSRAPVLGLADKVSSATVFAAAGIALITVIIWAIITGAGGDVDWEHALICGVSVLVISCPYAHELAASAAVMTGIGRGVREGIIIKSAKTFENLAKIDSVVFDKAGTVTQGNPDVTDVIATSDRSEGDIISVAASLECQSKHPLGKAICRKAVECDIEPEQADSFRYEFGKGIEAKIRGKEYFVGNTKYMTEVFDGQNFEQNMRIRAEELQKRGKTTLFLADKEKILGIIAIADDLKSTSAEAITMIGTMGIEQVMLTGDDQVTADAISRQVGIIDAYANVLPDDKESVIRELQGKGKTVAMVGDGVKDAPAMTAADVGIAIDAGVNVDVEAADIALLGSDLLVVEKAIRLSRATLRNVKLSMFLAFFCNLIFIPIATGALYPAFGWILDPIFAAALMSLLSICSVMNSFRLDNKKIL